MARARAARPAPRAALPATRTPARALRGGKPGVLQAAHRQDGVLRALAGQGRQPVDQRAELVLAEDPDHGLAVVLPHPPALRVQDHVHVPDKAHQLAALEDGLAVVGQQRPELLGCHLVQVLVQRVERPPRGDQLRRRLLPHPGDPRDVVRGIALERLVVQHLVGPQPPALLDLRQVVDERVGDAAAQRDHQPRVLADQLEHVEVAGEDGDVQVPRDSPAPRAWR